MVGPDYKRPPAAGVTAGFKEAPPGWTVAQPQDAVPKGEQWSIYHDPLLNQLEWRVVISNQNVRQFEAQYREAAATVDIARSALFPTVTGTASVTRSLRGGRGFGTSTGTSGLTSTGRPASTPAGPRRPGSAAALPRRSTRPRVRSIGTWTFEAASAGRSRATWRSRR